MKQKSLVNKILNIFTKWNVGIFLFLFIGQCIIKIFGFEFRSWIDFFRALQIIFILPINLVMIIILKMFDKEKNAEDIKTVRLANPETNCQGLFNHNRNFIAHYQMTFRNQYILSCVT